MVCFDMEDGGYLRVRVLTLVSSPSQEPFLQALSMADILAPEGDD